MKLLLAEDEKDLSSAIVKILKHNNYVVDAVYDGSEALEYLALESYDGVILDVMMPKTDGITVVKKLREQKNNVPVLMLTAKSQIDDRVLGLDAGADDYLTKPFAMSELLARIRAVTRRKNVQYVSLTFANLTLDPNTFEISTVFGSVRLTGKEYQLMEFLISNSDMLISTEKLMDKIWGYDSDAEINVVWVYISALRKKLMKIGANIEIASVKGIGYKLEAKR